MSLELIVFLIVAAAAIFSSAFMLISRNAVHSALFLVTTMICLAFFYLILNAPFLAMVQITVYAGAIMVLFLFVIMLLGADKLDSPPTHYRWLSAGAVGLATLFMITAFVAVVQGNVDLLKPIPQPSEVRVVNARPGTPAMSVYAGNTALVGNLTFQVTSDYQPLPAGTYKVEAFAAHTDGSAIDLTKDQPVLAASITVPADSTVTLIAAQDKFIAASDDVSPVADDSQFHYVAVNALPGTGSANLLQLNASDVTKPQVAAAHLAYGDASQPLALPAGAYTLAWEVNGQRVASYPAQTINADTEQLLILAPDPNVQGAAIAIQVNQRTQPSFGSPQQIGEQLFGPYLLPFELVSLVLLAAMVGAILMTREEVIRRERKRLIVGPHIARLNQAADQLAVAAPLTASNPVIANPTNVETRTETAAE